MKKRGFVTYILLALLILVALILIVEHLSNKEVRLSPLESCSDGTLYGGCSLKGLYCDSGKLVENCNLCGCSQPMKQEVYENDYSSPSFQEKGKGYILELKSDPYLKVRRLSYRSQLMEEHLALKQNIQKILGKSVGGDIKVLGESEDTFNSLTLDISKDECDLLKSQISLIKGCFPNLKVHALLDKSVPVIKADVVSSNLGFNGNGSVIAIIDTGIDATHESLDDLDDNPNTNDSKVIAFKDFVNFKTKAYDDHGHGTHCAGIAAGTGGPEGKYKGVAPGARLVGVKVLDGWGSGYFSDIIAGIEWTIQNKQRYNISVISMSLGANVNGDGTSPVEIAATTAAESGINFVVAAGNAGSGSNTVGIPASANKVITVGAIDNNKKIASFSSRGPTKDGRIKPEVSAPGVAITAPEANSINGYIIHSGTSMATPHVAGLVALLLSANSSITSEQMRRLLMDSAEDKGAVGPDNDYGWGIINALSTVSKFYKIDHDVAIESIESGTSYDINTPIRIKVVVKNYGANNETGLLTRFFVNGVEQEERNINLLSAGETKSLEFVFVANNDGVYETKISIDPIAGEKILSDNSLERGIIVKGYTKKIKAVVLDSWGTFSSEDAIWADLNNNWFAYGSYKIEVDYTSLDKKEVTYDLLKASNADVLIISGAWQDGSYLAKFGELGTNWEFSDQEIDAIKKYVSEGHGLIITSGTLSTNSPGNVENNMKLAPLVGLDENSKSYWAEFLEDGRFNLFYRAHELFEKMDTYNTGFEITNVLLELNKQNPGDVLAKSYDNKSIITGYNYGQGNTIYLSHMAESANGGIQDRQIFYNALLWTSKKYQKQQHDIRLSDFNGEGIVNYGEQSNFTLNITNKGKISEDNIRVTLIVNEEEVNDVNVSLDAGQTKELEFPIEFKETGNQKVSIRAEEITPESYAYDNIIFKDIFVPSAYINEVEDLPVDLDGNGKIDKIVLVLKINAINSGLFGVGADLVSRLGVLLAHTQNFVPLEKGTIEQNLTFDGIEIKRMGLSGPFKIENLALEETDGKIGKTVLYNTSAYNVDEFESYPDLTIDSISVDEGKKVVNRSFNVGVSVKNRGTEDAKNVNVSLYKEESGQDVFVGSQNISTLEIMASDSVTFSVNSLTPGRMIIKARVIVLEDKNLDDNEMDDWIYVNPMAAVLKGSFNHPGKVVLGKEINLTANIENTGVEEAKNVNVSLYKEESGQDVFVGSQNISTLAPDELEKLYFSMTPTKIGFMMIRADISADNSYNDYTQFWSYIDVAADGADVTGTHYTYSNLIVNESGDIRINIGNAGTKSANNVLATVYKKLEGQLEEIEKINVGSLSVDQNFSKTITITPNEQTLDIILEVNADNDVNPANNRIEKIYDVRLKSPDLYLWRDYSLGDKLTYSKQNNISFTISNNGVEEAKNVSISLSNETNLINLVKIGDLSSGEEKQVNISYVPAVKGWINFIVNVSADNEDSAYIGNNIGYYGFRSSSGADLYVYHDDIRIVSVVKSNVISAHVYNDGIEEAKNVKLFLYEMGSSQTPIMSKQLDNIGSDKSMDINLTFNLNVSGPISLGVNVSADNEEDYQNNLDQFDVYSIMSGANPAVKEVLEWTVDPYVGEEVMIPVVLINSGDKTSDKTNIYLSSFVDANEKSIYNGSTDALASGEKRTVYLPYTPLTRNEYGDQLKVNISSRGDIYTEDNFMLFWIYVYEKETDVSGKLEFHSDYANTKGTNYLDVNVINNGRFDEKNIAVDLYDNGEKIYDSVISLLKSGGANSTKVLWSPKYAGIHNLSLTVNASKDINPENDVYNISLISYDTTNVTFRVSNPVTGSESRYIHFQGKKFLVNGLSNRESLMTQTSDVAISRRIYSGNALGEVFFAFENSTLSNEMNITSGYYENLTDGSKKFRIAYVNKPAFQFDKRSYYLIYSNPDEKINSVSIYGCSNWSFIDRKCYSNWSLQNKSMDYVGEDGVYVSGKLDNSMMTMGIEFNENSDAPPRPNNESRRSSSRRSSGGTVIRLYSNQDSGEKINIDLDNENSKVEYLGLKVLNSQDAGIVQFNDLNSPSSNAPKNMIVYSYFEIVHPGIENTNIASGEIVFKVSKQWMEENSLKDSDILLMKYEGSWTDLPTFHQSSDGIFNYYRANLNGMSEFAIGARIKQEVPQNEGSYLNYLWMILLPLLILLVLVFIVMKLVRSKPHIEQQKTIRIEDKKEELFFEARIIVRKARQNGYPDEAIRQGFKNKGWKDEDINKIMI